MLTDSIRWRMQLWLGILLIGMLVAFGATSWQLEKDERIRRLDDELAKRCAALGVGVRTGGGPPGWPADLPPGGRPGGPGGPPPGFGKGRGGPEGDRFGPPPDFGPARGAPVGPPGGKGGPGGPPPDFARSEFPEERDGPLPIPPDMPQDRVPDDVKALFPEKGAVARFYYSVWVNHDLRQQKSALAPEYVPMPSREGRSTQMQFRDRDGMREAYHFTERGECVLAGRPLQSDFAAIRNSAMRLSLTGLVVLAVGLGGGWVLTSRSIRPIEQIAASARRISEGDLSERIPEGRRGNELGQLAMVLNSTFAKLEDSFIQQKRFTSDASHELRTPLTVLITETQAALSRERSAGDYREALEGNLETAREMKKLTEALLELARLDAGTDSARGLPFDLAEVAGKVTNKLRTLAEQRSIRLLQDLQPVSVNGSPERLGLVISNLTENAIFYGKRFGNITVSTWETDENVFLRVADDGPGIAPEDLPHLFDRFYRADKSRTGSRGRYGLGLAICRGLVEAEDGVISVESVKGEGAAFTVKLPKATASPGAGLEGNS
ncbi:sensor histidine kinase [Luteolibacter luteus]|uniref:histidine kinase n=1 Tax=Luteolibacter luteus TaxID=2728835 RepID=A0A858RDV9_9BACT|nr:ATP-binding protein [Luteolibacter luteus]QJE94895.1 HAMP domain-containing protein [Luteolibacter luteus]